MLKFFQQLNRKRFYFAGLFALVVLLSVKIYQVKSANVGNTVGYAWSEIAGWVRFDGTDSGQDYGVTVATDGSGLSGFAWGEGVGYIKMAGTCSEAGGCPGGVDTYGVVGNTTSCAVGWTCLSGYAWSDTVGWIKFSADGSDYANTGVNNYGVYIDGDNFSGFAWSENIGWINFSGSCAEAGGCPSGVDTYGPRISESVTASTNTQVGVKITATGGNIVIANNKINVQSSSGDGHKGVLVNGFGVSADIIENEINVSGSGTNHYGLEARYANVVIVRNTINATQADVVASIGSIIVASGQNRLQGAGDNFRVSSASAVIESANDFYNSVNNIGTFRDLTGDTRYSCLVGTQEGDAVYVSGNNTVAQADANNLSTLNIVGFVSKKLSATECLVKTYGKIYNISDSLDNDLNAGDVYYVSDVAGAIDTAPASGYLMPVGVSVDENILDIRSNQVGVSSIFASSTASALTIVQSGTGDILRAYNGSGEVFRINNNGEVVNGTWMAQDIGTAYGGTGTSSSVWTGFAFVDGGVWSASNTISASKLDSLVMIVGEDISLLNNNLGFVTTSDDTVDGSELNGLFGSNGILVKTADNTFSVITDASSNWNWTYNVVNASSTNWQNTYQTVFANSALWSNAYGWGNHASFGYFSTTTDQILEVAYGGTGTSTWQAGALVYSDVNNHLSQILKGTEGQVLVIQGGVPIWSNTAVATEHPLLGAQHSDVTDGAVQRGDLISGQGGTATWARLALGPAGYILRSNGVDLDWSTTTNITALGIVNVGRWEADVIGIAFGGTGATTATGARENLGLTDIHKFGVNATGTDGYVWKSDGDGRGEWVATSSLGIVTDFGNSNIPKFIGTTTAKYYPDFATSSLVGYKAANAICDYHFVGSHMCQTYEIIVSIEQYDILTWSGGSAWIAEGTPGYTENANDCNGWTSSSTAMFGAFWAFDSDGGGKGWLTSCQNQKAIACCEWQ